MRYGVALKPGGHKLASSVDLVLAGFEILPWTSEAAAAYGHFRAGVIAGEVLPQAIWTC